MHLHTLQVENYRAIEKAFLTFDEAIVIIGENDCGKSTLLDALHKLLGPHSLTKELAFDPIHYFHKNGVHQPIKMTVCFVEKTLGEWSNKVYSKIQPYLTKHINELRSLTLTLSSTFNNDEPAQMRWSVRFSENSKIYHDKNLVDWIRKVNPTIRLSAGMLSGHGTEYMTSIPNHLINNCFPEELQPDIIQVYQSAQQLFTKQSTHYFEDIEDGYQAALKINNYLNELPGFDGIILNLGKSLIQSKKQPQLATSNSEKLGSLFMMTALITACNNTPLDEVDPIWIIEDPEAHLHKITLATISHILRGINGQKIITTNSGGLLASFPLTQMRKLVRTKGLITEHYVHHHEISKDDTRKIDYHLRAHRNGVFFSRVWLLVEGETDFWILPQFAKILDYDFAMEGISCVEYAQSGLKPLLRVAKSMNIQCFLLADGDNAGFSYANKAKHHMDRNISSERICILPSRDIEHYLWKNGFADVYIQYAKSRYPQNMASASSTIKRAIRRYSKPQMALAIIDAATAEKPIPIPSVMVELIEKCVKSARGII